MPAWEDQPEHSFKESCCDGGVCTIEGNSAQPCGCDMGMKPEPHYCAIHAEMMGHALPVDAIDTTGRYVEVPRIAHHIGGGQVEVHTAQIDGIQDSGKRVRFASGSLRDPSEGKIKWSRITFGPMMRRWAQHLTTAEAKYPDPKPGYPNFMLIETEEELVRYKESAFRHFMSWFHGETDEDHAAAVFFNINGVEIIKEKRK